MEDVDLYGDGLATELVPQDALVTQAPVPMQQSMPSVQQMPPMQIKTEVPIISPLPPPLQGSVIAATPPTPVHNVKPVYVTKDSFQQENNRYLQVDPHDIRSKTVFVGNLTWWTTDVDLTAALAQCNVTDIEQIKFFENRSNGQSKGYCSIDLSSVESAKTLLNQLRNVTIHNEHPYVAIASKTPLYYFENSLGINKDGDSAKNKDGYKGMGQTIPPVHSLPPPPMHMPGMPPGMVMPGMPPAPGCPLPPPMPLPPPVGMGTPVGMLPPPEMLPPPGMMPGFPAVPGFPQMPSTGAHINPAFLPNAVPKQPGWPEVPALKTEPISDEDRKAMIERNHQVCKTAILRAYENCDSKQYEQAEMTVSAALKIIKFSAVADDAKSKSFITDLVECLDYVQTKTKRKSGSRNDKSRESSRSRSDRKDKDRTHRDSDRRREKRRSRSPVDDRVEKRRSRSRDKRREEPKIKKEKTSDEYKDYEKYNTSEYEDYKELRRRELI